MSKAPTLNSIGPAPTAVSAKPVRAVAVVAICHEFMPTIFANVFSWGASMSTVTCCAHGGVDRDVDGHAADPMLVAVDAGRLPGGGHGCGIPGERLVVVDEERVRSGERGEVAGGLLVATVSERGTTVEDQADHGNHGDECESEDDDDLATLVAASGTHVEPLSGYWISTVLEPFRSKGPNAPRSGVSGSNGAVTSTRTRSPGTHARLTTANVSVLMHEKVGSSRRRDEPALHRQGVGGVAARAERGARVHAGRPGDLPGGLRHAVVHVDAPAEVDDRHHQQQKDGDREGELDERLAAWWRSLRNRRLMAAPRS